MLFSEKVLLVSGIIFILMGIGYAIYSGSPFYYVEALTVLLGVGNIWAALTSYRMYGSNEYLDEDQG